MMGLIQDFFSFTISTCFTKQYKILLICMKNQGDQDLFRTLKDKGKEKGDIFPTILKKDGETHTHLMNAIYIVLGYHTFSPIF